MCFDFKPTRQPRCLDVIDLCETILCWVLYHRLCIFNVYAGASLKLQYLSAAAQLCSRCSIPFSINDFAVRLVVFVPPVTLMQIFKQHPIAVQLAVSLVWQNVCSKC